MIHGQVRALDVVAIIVLTRASRPAKIYTMARLLALLPIALAAACGGGPSWRPYPGVWRPVDRRGETALARDFGSVRLLVVDPKFDGSTGTVAVRMWVQNQTNKLVVFTNQDMVLIEEGGNRCRNEAPAAQRELSGVGDEAISGEFVPRDLARCRSRGFTVRVKVTPYSTLADPPEELEVQFRPN
jgi:hypothetical protein